MFPAADILLIDARYAYLFDVIDKHKYKKVIVTGINSYHNIEAFKKILRNKIKKLIFVEHDQYFEFMLWIKCVFEIHIAFLKDICDTVYATKNYNGQSVKGNILDSIEGNIMDGYTMTKTIII